MPPAQAMRGLGAVTLDIARAEPTAHVLTAAMGLREAGEYAAPEDGQPVRVYAVGPGGLGVEVHLTVRPGRARGAVGIGGGHQVAFRRLALPPFLEPQRAAIEAGIRPLLSLTRTGSGVEALTREGMAD